MASGTEFRVFTDNLGDCWPQKDIATGRWLLYTIVVEEIRPNVSSILVKEGHRLIFKDCVETGNLQQTLAFVTSQDICEKWKVYLDECTKNGYDPLNALPAPPLFQKTYEVTLFRNLKGVYLSDPASPVDVQHHMQCFQTEDGLKVADEWARNFVGFTETITLTITVPTRPSIKRTSDWYRNLSLNLYGMPYSKKRFSTQKSTPSRAHKRTELHLAAA